MSNADGRDAAALESRSYSCADPYPALRLSVLRLSVLLVLFLLPQHSTAAPLRKNRPYREAEARLTGGKFANNNAFSSHAERNAHVALVPDCDDAILARLGPSRVASGRSRTRRRT